MWALLIEKQNHVDLKGVMQHMPQVFRSEEYMRGFLAGYLFNSFTLLKPEQYAAKVNGLSPSLADKWLVFVYVTAEEQDNGTN